MSIEDVLREHGTVATGLGEWCCKCSPMVWRPTVHRAPHVGAAIRAHLTSDTIIQRTAMTLHVGSGLHDQDGACWAEFCGPNGVDRTLARAALTAATEESA